jgi:hypothetical protein
MSEIYWITRFDPINTCAMVFLVLSAIVTGVFTIGFFTCLAEDETESLPVIKKILKISTPILAICLLIKIFVPTTKQALLIYGVGGTIDYVKSNPTAKQLPDKCVNALDKWVDSWTLDEKTDSIKK